MLEIMICRFYGPEGADAHRSALRRRCACDAFGLPWARPRWATRRLRTRALRRWAFFNDATTAMPDANSTAASMTNTTSPEPLRPAVGGGGSST